MSLVTPFEEIFAEETGLLAKHRSWKRVQLGEVCRVLNGYPFKSSLFNREKGFPIIRIRDLSRGTAETFYAGDVPKEVVVSHGDLLIGMDGIFRCWEWHGGKAGLNQRVCKIIPDERVLDKRFLFYALNGYLQAIEKKTSSVTVGHLSSRDVLRIPLPFPPFAEQQRIVMRLNKLLGQVGTCQERLAKIPTLLKRFRQSVLAAACSGHLTGDWRDRHKAVRPARDTVQSLNTPDPETHLDIFERSSDSEIPETWSWVCLGKLGPLVGGGTPSTGNAQFWNGDIPWVSPKDMKRTRIRDSEDHITELGLKNSSVSKIDPGAILFVVRGMILNHTLPTAITDVAVTLNQDMKALVPEVGEMSEYLSLAARHIAPSILFEVKEATHGTRRIESSVLKNWAIPLPPLEEQPEIVRRVESLFTLADQIEARFVEGQKRVDSLTQAILAKAFRGELVPTEFELAKAEGRSFESAEELLERIGRNGEPKRKKTKGSS